MDIIAHLTAEHRKIRNILEVIASEKIRSSDLSDRIERLRSLLGTHVFMEEKILYPVLKRTSATVVADAAEREPDLALPAAAAALGREKRGTAEWTRALSRLRDMVDRHVHIQEERVLAQARAAFGDAESDAPSPAPADRSAMPLAI